MENGKKMRLIDADAIEYHMMAKEDWLGCTVEDSEMVWKADIDSMPTVEAVPVSFIESEIKRMDDDINTAMNDGEPEWAERSITRQTTLQMLVEMWRLKRKEK